MRTFLPAVLAASLLAAMPGCGSDDGTPTTASAPSVAPAKTAASAPATTAATEKKNQAAHRRFIAKANPICRAFNAELRAAQRDLDKIGQVGNVDVYAPGVRRAKSAAQRASRRFDAVKPPAFEREQAAVIGRALKAQVKANDFMLQAALADDPQQFAIAQQALAQIQPQLQALVRGFGMQACGVAS